MTTDILIRSYWRDLPWLQYCLRAIDRFCVGFREVVLVVPKKSEPWLKRYPPLPGHVRLALCPDYRDDYLGQQVTKLYADTWSDADLICHVDADFIFARRVCPGDLTSDGLPRIYTRPTADLPRHWPWTRPTEEFLGWTPSHDYMQHPPFLYPHWLYSGLRRWWEAGRDLSAADWVLSRPPRGFSEFNALGAFAHVFHRDAFAWLPIGEADGAHPECRWYWSWGGLDAATRRDIEDLIQGGAGIHDRASRGILVPDS